MGGSNATDNAPSADAILLARLDERTKSIGLQIDELKKTIKEDMEALRKEIELGFGDVKNTLSDHERRIIALESERKQRDGIGSFFKPVVVAVVTSGVLFVVGALVYLIVSHGIIK